MNHRDQNAVREPFGPPFVQQPLENAVLLNHQQELGLRVGKVELGQLLGDGHRHSSAKVYLHLVHGVVEAQIAHRESLAAADLRCHGNRSVERRRAFSNANHVKFTPACVQEFANRRQGTIKVGLCLVERFGLVEEITA